MKKQITLFLLLIMSGFAIYFIFLGKVVIGASLLMLSAWLDFQVMKTQRKVSK